MDPKFITTSTGHVEISLPPEWEWLAGALEDSFGTRPPKGSLEVGPSTYWIDRALTLMERIGSSPVELSAGNMSRFTLTESTVTISADYDTFDDFDIPVWSFSGLLKQWRAAVLVAAAQVESVYDDEYPTCARTYASLRVFSRELAPEAIAHLLDCEPTSSYRIGDPIGRSGGQRSTNAWFLSSKESNTSRDLRRHIDWLLDRVNQAELRALKHERNAQSGVFCFWKSTSGHGGPTLEPGHMIRLADLGLTLDVDVYDAD